LRPLLIDFQKEGEQTIDQQEAKGKDLDEVFQSHEEEQELLIFLPRIMKIWLRSGA
jgi:hypothetical protein